MQLTIQKTFPKRKKTGIFFLILSLIVLALGVLDYIQFKSWATVVIFILIFIVLLANTFGKFKDRKQKVIVSNVDSYEVKYSSDEAIERAKNLKLSPKFQDIEKDFTENTENQLNNDKDLKDAIQEIEENNGGNNQNGTRLNESA